MKSQLSNGRLKGGLLVCFLIVVIGAFLRYSETVSSEKIEKDTKTKIEIAGSSLPNSQINQIVSFPINSKAVAFGESIPVRYMPRVEVNPAHVDTPPRDIDEERENGQPRNDGVKPDDPSENEKEINKTNKVKGRIVDPTVSPSHDAALSTDNKYKQLSPQVLPTPTVSFDGVSFSDTVALGQGFLPPDTVGEAGPNHYVQAVNVTFRIWDKLGNPLIVPTSLGSLFSALPGPCRSSIDGDPVVIYDQLADRWLISQLCFRNVFPRHQLIAVSKTGDPTGAYYLYDFEMPNNKFNDYPKFGVWPDGYYMTDNQFDQNGFFFRGLGFFAFDRSKMLLGDPSASYVYFDSCKANTNCKVFGGLPSDIDGLVPPPSGTPNTFAYFTADEFGDPQGDGIRLFDLHADFSRPDNSTLTERTGSPLPVAAFDPLIPQFIPEPNAATTSYLDPISDRLMNRLAYRNFGGGRETLVMTHSVNTAAGNQAGVRYYELDRSTPTGPYTIAEQQTFSPDAVSRWMASGAMNYMGDTAIGFSASSGTVFPSIRYAAKLATDPPGSGLAQGEQNIITGSGSQSSSTQRWGDYSDMSVDPSDDCSFWYTQEYYATSGSAPWQTRIAKFTPRPCTVSPRGTIRGTVTSCATGLPLAGASLEGRGGYERLTGSNGVYSMTLLPGIYTLSAKKHGYVDTLSGAITLSDGGTATQNFCLAPIATFDETTPLVTSGNFVIEPNECNYVNIPLTNSGVATATVVQATLSTTTPGVTVTSAVSAYPDMAAGGGVQTNSTPFQIVTDNTVACFSTIDLKLTLSFNGGGSPSVLNFKMPVGQATGTNYAFTATNGASITSTGNLVQGSQQDDAALQITTPFAFSLYGKPVTSGQTIYVSTNGVVEMISQYGIEAVNNSRLPGNGFESPATILFPYWDDLDMDASRVTNGGIFTELAGAAPNRTWKIEWRARHSFATQTGVPDTDFAVMFHENSDDFEYIYQLTGSYPHNNGWTATVGIQAASYGSNFTQYSYHSLLLGPGLKLAASRPPAVCVRGSGTCSATFRKPFDFDGDGKTDISIFRPSAGEWWYSKSSDGGNAAAQFGSSTDKPVPADYTADGKTDIAFFRPSTGQWFVLRSEDFSYYAVPYGQNGDIPIPGDYDRDNKADIAVYRPSNHYFYIQRSSDGVTINIEFGQVGDLPVPADYDGDGKTDPAIWRPVGATGGEWWGIKSTTGGLFVASFGSAGDKAVPGDYTGDGKADIAVWRPSTGEWFVLRSEDYSYFSFPFGTTGDIPSPGDYDGDGKFDAAVFRPSTNTWYVNRSTAGVLIQTFGTSGDIPVPNAFVR